MNTINTKDCGTHLFRVSLWCGCGYSLDTFDVYAFGEEEALEHVLAYCEECSFCDLFMTADYIVNKLCLTEEERGEMYIYIDPTMTDGRSYPAYLRLENLRKENLGRVS